MTERSPAEDQRKASRQCRLEQCGLRPRPVVVLRGEIDNDRRVGQTEARNVPCPGVAFRAETSAAARGEAAHPRGNVLRPRRHRGADSREDAAVRHTDGQRPAATHRHSAEINAIAVDGVFCRHPLNGIFIPEIVLLEGVTVIAPYSRAGLAEGFGATLCELPAKSGGHG